MLNIDDRLIKEVSPKIGPNALSVLLAIAIHLNQKTNRCFPSHSRLMELTGLGKNSVYDALKVLKDNNILVSEQHIDSQKKQFGRRTFRLTTRFVSIFVTADEVEPLPESREPENREPENREPENRETYQLNKVEQINNLEQINKGECGPPPQNDSPTLEEKPLKIPTAGAGPGGPPNWGAYPKADTPEQLRENLSAFYKANPEEWRAVKDGTPAANWDAAKTRDVVGDFCAWAITEGFQRRDYSQINARLKTWFKKQPNFDTQNTNNTPARPTRPVRTA